MSATAIAPTPPAKVRGKNRMSRDQRICAAYDDGVKAKEIADAEGMSIPHVTHILMLNNRLRNIGTPPVKPKEVTVSTVTVQPSGDDRTFVRRVLTYWLGRGCIAPGMDRKTFIDRCRAVGIASATIDSAIAHAEGEAA